ncbi:MAG: UDP-glucose 4-epimerase GalE [Alphaproteobacteria bacterium]|nr:UDP-glucose 4-epimerase GalE [Alphaproteobacteria bacterium]
MTSRNILVTGGAGYVGSHACKALAADGWTPVVFDNLTNGHDWAVRWGPLVVGDVRNRAQLRSAMETYHPKGVLHFAGRIEPGDSLREPIEFYDVNVGGTIALLEAMADADIRALIFSSTAAIYGNLDECPATEDHPCNPFTPYGRSKLMAEQVIEDVGKVHGISWTAARYFNAAGADADLETGEAHMNEVHLIPRAIEACLGRSQEFSIFGTDYPTPDGTCIRDFIHVTDLATAHVAALNRLLAGGTPVQLNLGTGKGVSVLELIKTLEEVAGSPVPTTVRSRRIGDPPILVSDATRAHEVLSWQPRHSDVTTILKDAWAWHRGDTFVQKMLESR